MNRLRKPRHADKTHLHRARAAVEALKAANRLEGDLPRTARALRLLHNWLLDPSRTGGVTVADALTDAAEEIGP